MLLPPSERFPPAELADPEGLVGFGGELSPEWLLDAYRPGYFPGRSPISRPRWPGGRPIRGPSSSSIASTFRGGCGEHAAARSLRSVSYTHLRAHETDSYLVCRLLLE